MMFLTDPTMKHALAGAIIVALGSAPLGVMLVLRRMSLMSDVMSHAILPGIAAGFILSGMSIPAMSIGGLLAGLAIALASGLATRLTALREDANLAALYLTAVAIGVLLIALKGSAQNLEDILFGDAKSIDAQALAIMGCVTIVTLLTLAVIYRPLVVESFDPIFMRAVRGHGGVYHILFLMLTVLNLVESYRALGTLMAAGLMVIPAIAAQFWTRKLPFMMLLAIAIAVLASIGGLWIAHDYALPSGPCIVLIVGGIYLGSMLFGPHGSIRARYFPFRHLET